MIVQIRVRRDDGAYTAASPGQFADGALRHIIEDGGGHDDGWWFLRHWLCQVCLAMAQRDSDKPAIADLWISRYQAVRGIE